MLFSLHPARKYVVRLAACVCVFSFLGQTVVLGAPATMSSVGNQMVQEFSGCRVGQSEAIRLAHHESGSLGATQLITTGAQVTSGNPAISESLWGNLILNMAYQRDAELQKVIKKFGRVNVLTLTSVAAISGLGMASSIDSLATLEQDPHPAHPVVLSLVGSGLSLLSIGSMAYFSHRYKKQIKIRQHAIMEKVEHILSHLEEGGAFVEIQPQLIALIGERATREFQQLWNSSHPAS